MDSVEFLSPDESLKEALILLIKTHAQLVGLVEVLATTIVYTQEEVENA
jgi:hypothetical protein